MHSEMSRRASRRLLACGVAALSLSWLAGCQGHRVVARVNSSPINEEEYMERVQRTTQMLPNTDAGGTALVSIIREKLTTQLAAQKNAIPSEDAVRKLANYSRRSIPQLYDEINAGQLDESDFLNSVRFNLEEFGIGTEGAKATEAEVQEMYRTQKDLLAYPDMWTVRLLQVPDPTSGQVILDQLKKDGNFANAARQMGADPMQASAAGKAATLIASGPNMTTLLTDNPSLREALAKLNPNEFLPAPMTVQARNPQAPTSLQNIVILVQLVKRLPGKPVTLDETRPLIEQTVIAKKNPEWRQHKNQQLAEFTGKKSDIQINVKRYQPLLSTYILPQAEGNAATGPNGTLGGGAGASLAPPAASVAPTGR